jgi:hypothetical protein
MLIGGNWPVWPIWLKLMRAVFIEKPSATETGV